MPRRMVRDWTDSQKMDGISAEAERLFVRLIMKADDYGRFHADPRIVRGLCFPLHDNLRTEHVGRWLNELHHRNLIFRYEIGAQALLAIINFGQRLKQSRAKFPELPGENKDWLPTSGNFRELPGSWQKDVSQEEEEVEVEEEEKTNDVWAGLPEALNTQDFKAAWESFVKYRRDAGFRKLKPVSVVKQWEEMAAWGLPGALQSIEQTIRKGWQGLFAPKSEPGQKPQSVRKDSLADSRPDDYREPDAEEQLAELRAKREREELVLAGEVEP